jgi:hypothetical protein
MRTYRSHYHGPSLSNDPQLMDDPLEPTAREWDAARIELGPWASDQQIERRALQLLDEQIRYNSDMADEDEAESAAGEDWR